MSTIAFIALPFVQTIIARFRMTTMEDGSVFHRLEMFSWTFYHSTNNLNILFFGNGIGNTGYFLYRNPPSTNFLVIDNQYLTFLFEYGIIGFISIMLIFSLVAYRSYIAREKRVIFFVIIALMMNAFTWEMLTWYQTSIPFWLFIGLASVSNEMEGRTA